MIVIRGLSKAYTTPGGKLQALNGLNLTVEKGDIVGIIGFSGAGNRRW